MRRNKLLVTVTSLALAAGCVPVTAGAAEQKGMQNYIVSTAAVEKLEKTYVTTDTISGQGEDLAQKHDLAMLSLTADQKETLKKDAKVNYVEPDVMVTACGYYGAHDKKVKKYKKNTQKQEWNMQMIHGGKGKKSVKKKIKVAVLDSGVDDGNDLDLAYSATLVPGEEEMSPLFMDGSGHGNGVAGLIAAKDNKEGITGVNPNAEIYSIRVLDDDNRAPLSRIIEGIYMAIDQKVNIINMSFGVSQYSEALHQAVKAADRAGILMVAAAGNTGSKGVQYPAAFEEVMAVGSVDKQGVTADTSARGEELEIVAPGELVRTTGQLGDELVASGTSLAAPQVAGAASLLWEKDPDASADTIRYVLNASANLYGAKEQYGNGLLDVEYAKSHYEDMKQAGSIESIDQKVDEADTGLFEAKTEENQKPVVAFEETGCAEGSWKPDDHERLIPSNYSNVKFGARLNDKKKYIENGKYVFYGMRLHPWLHGYYQKSEDGPIEMTNYVSNYIYLTKVANNQKYTLDIKLPNGLTAQAKKQIDSEMAYVNLAVKEARDGSPGVRRAIMWGMAIHSLTDTFSHSVFIKGSDGRYHHMVHDQDKAYNKDVYFTGVHDTGKIEERWECAKKAVQAAMAQYNNPTHPCGTYKEFNSILEATTFKLGNISTYIQDVTKNSGITAKYMYVNYCL